MVGPRVQQDFLELGPVVGHKAHAFDNYVDWLAITYAISLTACPALSLPCGFNGEGLPIGLQMVGPPRGEAELLGYAHFGETLFNGPAHLPVIPD